MQINDLLAPMYVAWLRTQGLERGSAEDVVTRDGLTERQTKWLYAFITLWELSRETIATPATTTDTDKAFEIVLALAWLGICDATTDRAKHVEQARAVSLIRKIATARKYTDEPREEAH